MKKTIIKRREFFAIALGTIAALPLLSKEVLAKCVVGAVPAGKKVIKEGAKAAARLFYVDNASKVSALAEAAKSEKNSKAQKAYKKFKAGSACTNCKFYKTKKEEGGYAPCSMLGNKYVAGCGWCKSYKANKKKA